MYNFYVSFQETRKFLFLNRKTISSAIVSAKEMPKSSQDILNMAAYIAMNVRHLKSQDTLVIISIYFIGEEKETKQNNGHVSSQTKKNGN